MSCLWLSDRRLILFDYIGYAVAFVTGCLVTYFFTVHVYWEVRAKEAYQKGYDDGFEDREPAANDG